MPNPILSEPGQRTVAQPLTEVRTPSEILYPNSEMTRLALKGAVVHQLSWFDAHLWAYAEYYGLPELLSEDFEHDRLYGTVRAVNPFR